MRCAPRGSAKVSPCHWKVMKPARSSPNHWRAAGVSSTFTGFQPISFTGLRVTSAPSARDIICPPRQWPIIGTLRLTASRMRSSTGRFHGVGSLALIGPPMNARPAKGSLDGGTASPSSMRLPASFLLAIAAAVPLSAAATDVTVVGLFPGRAVVTIDRGSPRTLSVGEKTSEGVVLISVDSAGATLEVDGKRQLLEMGQHFETAAMTSSRTSVTLAQDGYGHFRTEAYVNGA